MSSNPIIAVPLNLELLHVCDALCITHADKLIDTLPHDGNTFSRQRRAPLPSPDASAMQARPLPPPSILVCMTADMHPRRYSELTTRHHDVYIQRRCLHDAKQPARQQHTHASWPECTSGTSRVLLMTSRGRRGLETLVSVCVCDTLGPVVGRGGPSSHAGRGCERHIRSCGILLRTPNNRAVSSDGKSMRCCVYRCDSAAARLAVRHRNPGADILSRFCLEIINIHYYIVFATSSSSAGASWAA